MGFIGSISYIRPRDFAFDNLIAIVNPQIIYNGIKYNDKQKAWLQLYNQQLCQVLKNTQYIIPISYFHKLNIPDNLYVCCQKIESIWQSMI